jgi:hypothetical protein
MIYVQLRYYFCSWVVVPIIQWPLLPKRIKLKLALWGMEVTLKTFAWKLKKGHKK